MMSQQEVRQTFFLVRIIMTDIRMYDTLLSSIFSVKMKLFENFFLYVFRTSFVLLPSKPGQLGHRVK